MSLTFTKTTLIKDLKKQAIKQQKEKHTNRDFSPALNEFIRCANKAFLVKKKNGIRYTEDMKNLAATLHSYSPKAYKFLRTHLPLPDESCVKQWMNSTDFALGANVKS